jgi:2-keto-4-pentenoate hydratase/2-oxohepta-3-ene-1,7-dioic acid hydratase in catechol pathway
MRSALGDKGFLLSCANDALANNRFPLLNQELRYAPPVMRPTRLLCVGLNYYDHIAEGGYERPSDIRGFVKLSSTLIGANEAVVKPLQTERLDYELELAIVIGGKCDNVTPQQAMQFVAGYSVFLDMTARDMVTKSVGGHLMVGKNFRTFGPLGPWITTADEVADPQACKLRLWVNDELRQDSTTAQMIFPISEVVSAFSVMGLDPGDVICTGTPGGVGAFHKPEKFLRPGDVIDAEIESVGRLRVTISEPKG